MGLGSLMRCETAVTGLPGGACARASTQDGSTRMGLGTRHRTTPPPPPPLPPLAYMLQCGDYSVLGRGHVDCRAVCRSANSGVAIIRHNAAGSVLRICCVVPSSLASAQQHTLPIVSKV